MKKIPLTHSKTAIVDDQDYPALAAYKWRAEKTASGSRHDIWVAVRYQGTNTVKMHRELLGLKTNDGQKVLHINGNRLDNRRGNIIATSHMLSCMSRRFGSGLSHYRGVSRDDRLNGWTAQIKIVGKCHYLGRYAKEADAALAYDIAAMRYFGNFHWLNFPYLFANGEKPVPPVRMKQDRPDKTSQFRGVSWISKRQKWQATVQFHKKSFWLGFFDSEEQAAHAYDNCIRPLKGRKAFLNFQESTESQAVSVCERHNENSQESGKSL